MVRNSWGTHFGENGYFRIQMHSHNLNLETDCVWAVPSFTPNLSPTSITQFNMT